ncbi:translesion DNA synthesis-associated protein ImuA [Pseudomonas sp. LPB0260]|uniref:translesion DNA synthesis-associated protein ImuA n=1 Tax=Pseudomonas sp. LPB0260 TaxID=2614442 RepID=UPI0015C2973E|nr:translesion DNA synthesis-associated protein ImuA [Pseudomonas sp. LPB0260]QLC73808.1 translesion DNA synthesis-associated protein ImuA [Pseudomonas sp. LPB0260]QLC76582.1 translesion DNA synthesis-associated protein ImuA [Pseudomonas sp. LPB0260]
MSAVISLDSLLDERRVWRGRPTARTAGRQPSGHAALDAALPTGGWPESALSEILMPGPGLGELHLLWPTLARLTRAAERVILVAPPFVPYAPAWQAAGLDLRRLEVIQASGRDALWAAEQCLRSGSCAALLCWPERADDRALRRLQVAAEGGQSLAFAYRPLREAHNPSPAALRLALDGRRGQVRVLKCRGGLAPAAPLCFAVGA